MSSGSGISPESDKYHGWSTQDLLDLLAELQKKLKEVERAFRRGLYGKAFFAACALIPQLKLLIEEIKKALRLRGKNPR